MTDKQFNLEYGIKGTRRYKKQAKLVCLQMLKRKDDFDIFLEEKDFDKLMKMTGYIQWLHERELKNAVL